MRITVVSAFFSDGMGYTENCLPRALANLGYQVDVVTSTFNVYGNSREYDSVYRGFLGPAQVDPGMVNVGNYRVHRLPARLLGGYVVIRGLIQKLREIDPDIVHCTEVASINLFKLALARVFLGYELYTETHQHLSVVRPYLRDGSFSPVKRLSYWMTRTLPTTLASRGIRRCFAIAPDCLEVAVRFYGVPREKMVLQSLGTDTALFYPCRNAADRSSRMSLRRELACDDEDIICVYTGRLASDKNPILLAQAVALLNQRDPRWRALFIGDGPQRTEIERIPGSQVRPFMRHSDLALYYRAADIAVWPRQESMSMLDAAASGLPIVVCDSIGESSRIAGNGLTYKENDVLDLVEALASLQSKKVRAELGASARAKMVNDFSWEGVARAVAGYYVRDPGLGAGEQG